MSCATLVPPVERSALLTGHVSQADLDFLRHPDPASDSPYRSVYRDGAGWQARAFKRRIGRVQPTARAAAEIVVRWWRQHYGDDWREFYGCRQTQGWTWSVHDKRAGSGWAVAFVDGMPLVLGEVGGVAAVAAKHPQARPFSGKKVAARLVRAWAAGTYRERASLTLRRRYTPTHSAGRLPPAVG